MPRIPDETIERLFPPKEGELSVVEDVTMGEEPIGLGFPGEVFELKCPECVEGMMRLRLSKHGPFYGCTGYPVCDATHGAHPDGRPKGIPGNKATKRARVHAHRVFDRLWKPLEGRGRPLMTRAQAYVWVQRVMHLSSHEAHIGLFGVEQCQKLVALVTQRYPGIMNAWDRLMSDADLGEENVEGLDENDY